MSQPKPWTPEELRQLPPRIDLFRSIVTGRLFELYHVDNDGTARMFDIETMTPASMPYDKFRKLTVQEPQFIGEDR